MCKFTITSKAQQYKMQFLLHHRSPMKNQANLFQGQRLKLKNINNTVNIMIT